MVDMDPNVLVSAAATQRQKVRYSRMVCTLATAATSSLLTRLSRTTVLELAGVRAKHEAALCYEDLVLYITGGLFMMPGRDYSWGPVLCINGWGHCS
jgi:hypothetical protein